MKKLFLFIICFFVFVSPVYAAEYHEHGITFSPHDTRDDVYYLLETHKEDALFVWNNFIHQLVNIDAEKACLNLDGRIKGELDNSDAGVNYILAILCYAEEKGTRQTFIKTGLEKNRNHNIDVGLKQFDEMILEPGKEVSANRLLQAVQHDFKDGNVLFFNNDTKKVDVRVETGGGVCGVTTGLYQNFLNDKNIEILERKPHSNWYNSYYGTNKGMDAMIYFGQTDFRFKNSGDGAIYVRAWGQYDQKNYTYFVRTKTLFREDRSVQFGKGSYKNKQRDRTCYDVFVDGKKITSCYRNVLQ